LEELGVVIIRFSDLDVKNNLSWVFLEIEKTIKNIKPSPKLTKEGIIYSYD
jgi:very-short-patch-repair endonuclease